MVENHNERTVIYSQLETRCDVIIDHVEQGRVAEAWITLSLLIDEAAAAGEVAAEFAASIMFRVAKVRKLREDDLATLLPSEPGLAALAGKHE
mgnify:CR=1 FL=1